MNCPTCGRATSVLATRKTPDATARQRECTQGHRFVTHERFADDQRMPPYVRSRRRKA